MTIAKVLENKGSTAVETIRADALLLDAVERLGEKRIGALPVVDEGRIVGIISERDVIYCLRDRGREALDLPISEVMSAPAITVDPATDVFRALALITERRIRHLPVVENGQIRGIVSIGDLVKYRMEMIEAEADAMRVYIQSA
jgi:CBS domain-containing protein